MGKEILIVLLFGIAIIVVYFLLKKFVLEKINVNKWLVLFIAFVLFLIPLFIEKVSNKNMNGSLLWYLLSGLSIVMFLWYIDLLEIGRSGVKNNNRNKIVMKSKPKPNRAKSLKDERKDK